MDWKDVCEHPDLQNLPFKIELNEKGQIVMSPVKVLHSLYQGRIEHELRKRMKTGDAMPECAIKTRKGTKVADVVWVSPERLERIKYETECSVAPEICIEVVSEANTDQEIEGKRALFIENGAEEVWLCTMEGALRFYNSGGELAESALVPGFPRRI
jgi:Uma2 family endonuclease